MKYMKPVITMSMPLSSVPNYDNKPYIVTLFGKPCGSILNGIWTLPNGIRLGSKVSWCLHGI